MACRLGATQLIHQAPLQNHSQAQTQSLDPGLQKMYPKYIRAAGDCDMQGEKETSVQSTNSGRRKLGSNLCVPEIKFVASCQLPIGTAFMELESSATSVHFYIVSSQQTMCFILACGSKNIIEILYGYRLDHLLFPLSQNYLLQNGPVWGLCTHKPYRQH